MTKEKTSQFPLPRFTIRQLLEAGVHFGHKTMKRNPKMSKYIYADRNNISIIDLDKTSAHLNKCLSVVKGVAKNNGRILFVSTKKQGMDSVALAAKRCGQYYVNFRWLGGMLTNWKTVSRSIKTLKKIEDQLQDNEIGYKKKERLDLERRRQKLEKTLGGIKNMGGYPDLVFLIDINKESTALLEASKLNIPVMAIIDTNCNTDNVTFPIPGNDDSTKSIKLICRLISDAAISGFKENMAESGIDISKLSGDYEEILQNTKTSNENQKKPETKKSLEVKSNNNVEKEKKNARAKKQIIKKDIKIDESSAKEGIKSKSNDIVKAVEAKKKVIKKSPAKPKDKKE